ncbi:hypothetical protein MUB24_13470 [Lederbergia sp. NSJ-179]|uniref:hypothetical protein n=1 Tax=Lederbergia sp. NSJ-179 TaxID=2931402 RepID=UPI001FD1940A|nr:hypothetical protein [Lederbergia sp. NSJ-179]MCJ7841889.1 hypothetical protein [Lederbergia sp. NSJ-179]
MRKMTLDEINKRIQAKRQSVDYAANKFRSKSEDEGWTKGRVRPRDRDEILALNRLARLKIRKALKTGEVQYDKESRVFSVDKYR